MDSAAQSANIFGNDNIVVQSIDSVVNVNVGARAFLRLTQFESRTRLAVKDNSEAALLSAYRSDVVPLLGREGALADLRAWLDRPEAVSVRVLVEAAGRGKTRLALGACALGARIPGSQASPSLMSLAGFAVSMASSNAAG